MGLKQVDMSECTAKCKCLTGKNAGQLYNVEEPCPPGYEFNAEECDCPQPCDWCPDLTAPEDSPLREGRCARLAGDAVEGVAGFAVDVIGSADEYYGSGSLLSNGCGTARSGSRVQFMGRYTSWRSVYVGGCPPRNDGSDRCRSFGLYYDPYDTPCGRSSLASGPSGGLTGVIPGRQAAAVDPFWKPGAFQALWLVDLGLDPSDDEYWLGRLLYSRAQSPAGQFSGDVGYFLGEFSIEIRCNYRT